MHTSPVSDVGESQSLPGPLHPSATPQSSHTTHNGWAACLPLLPSCPVYLLKCRARQTSAETASFPNAAYSTAVKKIPLNSAALLSVLPSGIVKPFAWFQIILQPVVDSPVPSGKWFKQNPKIPQASNVFRRCCACMSQHHILRRIKPFICKHFIAVEVIHCKRWSPVKTD